VCVSALILTCERSSDGDLLFMKVCVCVLWSDSDLRVAFELIMLELKLAFLL